MGQPKTTARVGGTELPCPRQDSRVDEGEAPLDCLVVLIDAIRCLLRGSLARDMDSLRQTPLLGSAAGLHVPDAGSRSIAWRVR